MEPILLNIFKERRDWQKVKITEKSFYTIPNRGDLITITLDGNKVDYYVKYRIYDENGRISSLVVQ